MPKAARFGDPHTCPKVEPGPVPHVGGPILQPCSLDIEIEDAAAARAVMDYARCEAGPLDPIAQGSPNVYMNDLHAARVGDMTQHGGLIIDGAATVEVGVIGDAVTLLKIDPGTRSSDESGEESGESSDDAETNGTSPTDEKSEDDKSDTESDGGVVADFELVHPYRPTAGKRLVFRCRSWDPDTGGSSGAPNPEQIAQRDWSVELEGREVSWSPSGRNDIEFDPTLFLRETNPRRPVPFAVTLRVVDRQGHTDQARRTFELHAPREEIVAVIHMREAHGASREIARTGRDGAAALPAAGSVVFEDHSFLVDEDGVERNDPAILASWDIRPSENLANSGGTGRYQPYTFRRGGRYTVSLDAWTNDRRPLRARARAVLDVGPDRLKAVITHHTHDASSRGESWIQGWLQPELVAAGDTVTVFGAHEPSEVEVLYEWDVQWDGRSYLRKSDKPNSITFWLDPTFVSLKRSVLKIDLRAVTPDGALRSRSDAGYSITVHPLLTVDNLLAFFGQQIKSLGLTAAVGAITALLAGLGVVSGAIAAVASQIVNRGLVDEGVDPLLANVITSLLNVGATGGVTWSRSKDAWMKVFRDIEARGLIGTHAYKHIADIWMSERAHRALDPAVRDALKASFAEFTQYLVNEGIISERDAR